MNSNFYKDLLDNVNENNSDVSVITPEDLENIVKGVDDMDDALFGFKQKQELQETKTSKLEVKSLENSKAASKKQPKVSDLPEDDLLADISLSDDDFYDVEKKPPSTPLIRDKINPSPKKTSQEKLTKSKQIANLFGLDDEKDVITESKKKQEKSAADWLGIKDSPVNDFGGQLTRNGVTDDLTAQDRSKSSLPVIKSTQATSTISKESDLHSLSIKKSEDEVKTIDNPKINSIKSSDNVFDLLGDENEQPKSIENPKDKKSAIFDELFGDNTISRKKPSRKNSAVKTPEISKNESSAPTAANDGSVTLGQYVPSASGSSGRRPGLGRRRETTPTLLTAPSSGSLFQEDWMLNSGQQDTKTEMSKYSKDDIKMSGFEVHESLPAWLGGSGILPEPKSDAKPLSKSSDVKQSEKPEPVVKTVVAGKPTAAEAHSVTNTELKGADQITEALATSSDQTRQTSLALQNTEAQLLAALQLQTTQSDMSAVCNRQRNLLDVQEKQLNRLVAWQAERQAQLEKQLTSQQHRIQQLLEVLTANVPAAPGDSLLENEATDNLAGVKNKQREEQVKHLENEMHKSTMENEELRLRMELMEKHYKMEFESLQVQHRREIESWEEKLAMQKELSDQLCEDFRERIARLKENQEEVIAQHNERVQRLREEKAEDMRQLMDFQKATLEQMMVISKLLPPTIREDHQLPVQTWKPQDPTQLSEREEEIFKKEDVLKALQEKLDAQKSALEKKAEEIEDKSEQEKIKHQEMARQLKQEKNHLKYQQEQLNQEKKHMEQLNYEQRKQIEEMQEKLLSEKTQIATEKLKLAEEKAELDALAKLQGVSGTATFDILKSKAEVHGALEAARNMEMQAVEERRKLREKERVLDSERWKLKEMERDLIARAQHLDHMMQVSEANQETGKKALEEASLLEKRAEEKLKEVDRRKMDLREKEKNLIKIKLDIAQEEIRLTRKREQLEHILPQLSSDEALTLQPIKDVIDPKMLIMKLRAEREFEASTKPLQVGNDHLHRSEVSHSPSQTRV